MSDILAWSSRHEGKILLAIGAFMLLMILVMMVSSVEEAKQARIEEDEHIRQIVREEMQ